MSSVSSQKWLQGIIYTTVLSYFLMEPIFFFHGLWKCSNETKHFSMKLTLSILTNAKCPFGCCLKSQYNVVVPKCGKFLENSKTKETYGSGVNYLNKLDEQIFQHLYLHSYLCGAIHDINILFLWELFLIFFLVFPRMNVVYKSSMAAPKRFLFNSVGTTTDTKSTTVLFDRAHSQLQNTIFPHSHCH